MLRRREPSARNLGELLIRDSRMSREGQLIERLQAEPEQNIVIVFENRLERLPLGHRRVLGRQFLHAAEGEIELNLKRLLAAERAVVVEDGYALGWRREPGASLIGHTRDKVEDRGFRGAVVPGGKRLGIDHAKIRSMRVGGSKWLRMFDIGNRFIEQEGGAYAPTSGGHLRHWARVGVGDGASSWRGRPTKPGDGDRHRAAGHRPLSALKTLCYSAKRGRQGNQMGAGRDVKGKPRQMETALVASKERT